jgi:hypothetical protein
MAERQSPSAQQGGRSRKNENVPTLSQLYYSNLQLDATRQRTAGSAGIPARKLGTAKLKGFALTRSRRAGMPALPALVASNGKPL